MAKKKHSDRDLVELMTEYYISLTFPWPGHIQSMSPQPYEGHHFRATSIFLGQEEVVSEDAFEAVRRCAVKVGMSRRYKQCMKVIELSPSLSTSQKQVVELPV